MLKLLVVVDDVAAKSLDLHGALSAFRPAPAYLRLRRFALVGIVCLVMLGLC